MAMKCLAIKAKMGAQGSHCSCFDIAPNVEEEATITLGKIGSIVTQSSPLFVVHVIFATRKRSFQGI